MERDGVDATPRAAILTISDTRSQGRRADTTTPVIRRHLESAGFVVSEAALIPDEQAHIQERLIDFADRQQVALVVTTGGTGLGPRDVTPEATKAVMEREVPGLAEAMRSVTARDNALAWLSRGVAGVRGRALIVNLPGSPQAVEECLTVLVPLFPHALEMMDGHSHG